MARLHGFAPNEAGIALAFASIVRVLRWLGQVTLTIVPIVTSAGRIHAHVVDAPDAITQELNQCMRLVNVAASRRTVRGARQSAAARRREDDLRRA